MAGVCEYCGVTRPQMERCSRCRETLYCSTDCRHKHWLTHKHHCAALTEIMEGALLQNGFEGSGGTDAIKQETRSQFVVKIKTRHGKSEVTVPKDSSGEETFLCLCRQLRIPQENIRLISRGKLITTENIAYFVANGAAFQAFGEEAEDETGLDGRDIDVLMAQLSVERNVAVKALRRTGDLIDAMLYVSDNQ